MPTGVGPNEYILDEGGRDLKSTAKKTLADYLSARTKGGAESFTPPVQGNGEYTYMPPRPNVYPIEPSELTEIRADASNTSEGPFATAADLNRLNGDPALRSIVKMEPATDRSGDRNGNTVLNSDAAKQTVAASVLTKNRFTAENKFTSNSYKTAMPAPPSSISNQGSSLGDNIFETMRRSALASMLNAAGGSSGPGSELFKIGDMSTDDQKLSVAALGRITKIGIAGGALGRIPVGDLRPAGDRAKVTPPSPTDSNYFENIYGRATQFTDLPNPDTQTREITFSSAEQNDALGNSEGFYTSKSYGQLNSYLQSFSGGGTLALVPLALLAYVALFIAVAVVSLVISLLIGKLPRPNYQKSVLPLGAERGPSFGTFLFDADSSGGASLADILPNVANIISKILGVMQPYEGPILVSYFLSALEGALGLIGVNTDSFTAGNIGNAIVTSAGNIVINFGVSPGYYLILIREISRDLQLLASPQTTESGLLGIIDGIRSLKLLRFVDTCARLGIVNSSARNSDNEVKPDEPLIYKAPAGGDSASPSEVETNWYSVAQRRVSRSKEVAGSRKLAWSHSALGYTRTELVTKDLLRALSTSTLTDSNGVTEYAVESLRRVKARKITSATGRIDPEIRRRHEELLDAEYMPFYFHDLRTNEILSFHAFLSSLTDSFTSNYNAVSGFGRMDPVQIYKDTTRSLSFSFTVVATSPEDHEQMWYSINKLVNMVYPQWSEGDTITGADGQKFIQPFSQTVASSPMLRLRIGDIIHSNYSRFAIGRLFGLDKDGTLILGKDGKTLTSPIEGITPAPDDVFNATNSAIDKTVNTQISAGGNPADTNLNALLSVVVENDAILAGVETLSKLLSPAPVIVPPGRYDSFVSQPSVATSSGTSTSGEAAKVLKYKDSEANGKVVGYKQASKAKAAFADAIVELDVSKTGKPDDTAYKYIVVPSEILYAKPVVPPSKIPSFPPGAPPPQNPQGIDAYNSFMDKDNNPIVRSFEEGAGGRGLAGFISQLGVEYGESEVTWTTDRGSRAPNMVKFSVTFLPIHDIPMGLASDGSARAIAYPVGRATRMRYMPDILNQDEKLSATIKGLGQPSNDKSNATTGDK